MRYVFRLKDDRMEISVRSNDRRDRRNYATAKLDKHPRDVSRLELAETLASLSAEGMETYAKSVGVRRYTLKEDK